MRHFQKSQGCTLPCESISAIRCFSISPAKRKLFPRCSRLTTNESLLSWFLHSLFRTCPRYSALCPKRSNQPSRIQLPCSRIFRWLSLPPMHFCMTYKRMPLYRQEYNQAQEASKLYIFQKSRRTSDMILVVMRNNQVINAADSERIHSCRNIRTVILFSAINNNGCFPSVIMLQSALPILRISIFNVSFKASFTSFLGVHAANKQQKAARQSSNKHKFWS